MEEVVARLNKLRSKMQEYKIDALIIPSSDPHQSEYVCDHWKVREYFSGFTGSSGSLVVFKEYAALWTDSRYFIQAEMQLKGSGIALHKQVIPHAPEHVKWMSEKLEKGSKIGIEGLLFSIDQQMHLSDLFEKISHELLNVDGMISEVWNDRPLMPETQVYELGVNFTGKDRMAKLQEVRAQMKIEKADFYLISALDEIAWLLNIRAWDIEFTPVALAYLLVGKEDARLYINKKRVKKELIKVLESENILIKEYEKIPDDLSKIDKNTSLYIDKSTLSWTLNSKLQCKKYLGESIINPLQAIKNDTEIENIKNALIKDGVALVRFFMWLESNYKEGQLKEIDLVKKLAYFRSKQPHYVGESFSAIVGFKGNGAIVHYSPDKNKSATINADGMLLVDSGGQYLDGTTDITRTIYLGEAKPEHKRNFTLVLKGNIALQCIQFPRGTCGMQLDTLARMYLWNEGLNYGHGTGHGVGFFLRVHEPPQGFATSSTTSRGLGVHKKGMLTSNEPGYYKENEYGIRIENLMICEDVNENKLDSFLKFKALTLFPISSKLMDLNMLDEKERKWINEYHSEVYEKLSTSLNEEEMKWLKKQCEAI